jgi:hypothetical protein
MTAGVVRTQGQAFLFNNYFAGRFGYLAKANTRASIGDCAFRMIVTAAYHEHTISGIAFALSTSQSGFAQRPTWGNEKLAQG